MKLYNTLTRQKEEFVPIHKGEVRMYVCGVTVYAPLHMGHISTYISYDVMSEYFKEFLGYKVFHLRNITDVGSVVGDADEGEDKIELKAKEQKLHPLELVDQNIKGMWQGLDSVRCARPNISPRATMHILEIIEAVQTMIKRGYAYEVDGDVYCDVSKIKNYGILSGNTLDKLEAGARLDIDSKKHNPNDFAVWKKAKSNSVLKWNSPWGLGYPGWHIECSVMSTKYLGQTFDIHGGGRELAFPHHENEIAQSMAINGTMPANYWVHAGMLNINGVKMSKSLGNYITVEDAIKKWGAVNLRWFFVNCKYNSTRNITDDALDATNAGLERIENMFFNLNKNVGEVYSKNLKQYLDILAKRFVEEMNDDLNAPNAISCIYDFVKQANTIVGTGQYNKTNIKEIKQFFERIDKVFKCFDFLYDTPKDENLTELKVKQLIEQRNVYRQNRDYKKADEIKAQIISMGVEIFDNKDGTTSYKITKQK